MTVNLIKVLIVDTCLCVEKENVERQHNVILKTVGNHDDSRKIGDVKVQALEREDKINAVTQGDIVDTKVSSSLRKFYS